MNKKKKVLFIILGIVLAILGIVLLAQAIHYGIMDHATQLELYGAVKDDITTLTYGQRTAETCCWIFGMISIIASAWAWLSAANII